MITSEEPIHDTEKFRDSISTITDDGKRNWIFPKKPSGWYYTMRTYVSWFLLGLMFAGPFIKINGNPILLLNIFERKFILFGIIIWPQDFYILLLGMITLIIFIVLFTAIWGRLFCGWACPQTIFMEMLFRKIEYWIDGDYNEQKKLAKMPWNGQKIRKRVFKHSLFYAVSLLIAHTFMAYLVGIDRMFEIISSPPTENMAGFTAMMFFSLVFFGVFARFREQVCLIVCPYGRLQSVLIDNNSVVVAYDFDRGETRGTTGDRKKAEKTEANTTFGDCIDCYQCVRVCPTGIDIRNGTQLECINCTACMDACDDIMEKINKPKGLVRYSSFNAIKEGVQSTFFPPRVLGYLTVFLILFTTLTFILVTRDDAEVVILREPGTLYHSLPDGRYSNFYQVKVFNKTFRDQSFEIKLLTDGGEIRPLGDLSSVKGHDVLVSRLLLIMDEEALNPTQTNVNFGFFLDGQLVKTVKSSFIGPSQNLLNQ